jgi:hypothetical protein
MTRPSIVRGIAVVGAGSVAAIAVWSGARLADVELLVGREGDLGPVGVADVLVATVLAGLGAWVVRALLEGRQDGDRLWPFIGSTALAVSMIGPSWFADGASAMFLMAMHFATGIVLIYGFARFVYRVDATSQLENGHAREWRVPDER